MDFDKKVCCCFTGHRPDKLAQNEETIKNQLRHAIEKSVEFGYRTFISGMARGVDIWAAEEVLRLKSTKDIALICACPYKGFENNRTACEKKLYLSITEQADRVFYLSPAYHGGVFMIRNRWMVDNSSLVIAAYNGAPGGTRNTINYAENQGTEVFNILDP